MYKLLFLIVKKNIFFAVDKYNYGLIYFWQK